MCNLLHYNSTDIPEEGYGYKIFTKALTGRELGTMIGWCYYKKDERGYAVYRKKYEEDHTIRNNCFNFLRHEKQEDIAGFCIFLNEEEATKVINNWDKQIPLTIRKIHYRKGLGKHQEDNFIVGLSFEIAIVKEFKPVNGWKCGVE